MPKQTIFLVFGNVWNIIDIPQYLSTGILFEHSRILASAKHRFPVFFFHGNNAKDKKGDTPNIKGSVYFWQVCGSLF